MEPGTYLLRLTARLGDGMARVAPEVRARQAEYLAKTQNADGGYSGREGGSDLYYTGFALRSLAVLDALTPDISARAATFLRERLADQASVVDFFSFLYGCLVVQLGGGHDVLATAPADWRDRVAAVLETFKAPDGGYAKAVGGNGSTYHTFLVALCYELLGRPLPQPDVILRFVQSRRRDDGGFVEIAPMKRSGVNPTAAAVGILQILDRPDALTDEVRAGVIDLFAELPSMEGGLRANGRVPLADLLSTFTGLWTLEQLGGLDRIDAAAVLEYAESQEMPDGGFRGGLWDERSDVEYTFYGLGVLALLS